MAACIYVPPQLNQLVANLNPDLQLHVNDPTVLVQL